MENTYIGIVIIYNSAIFGKKYVISSDKMFMVCNFVANIKIILLTSRIKSTIWEIKIF